jgi:hypothetical protein
MSKVDACQEAGFDCTTRRMYPHAPPVNNAIRSKHHLTRLDCRKLSLVIDEVAFLLALVGLSIVEEGRSALIFGGKHECEELVLFPLHTGLHGRLLLHARFLHGRLLHASFLHGSLHFLRHFV